MPLPKLSPLQSRLAASLMGSIMLLLLYLAFLSPQFAYAADVDSIRPEDHNHERLLDTSAWELEYEDLEISAEGYEAEFLGYDRSIIGRVPTADDPTALINNRVVTTNVEQGQTLSFSFLNSSLWGDLSPQASGLPSPVRLRTRAAEGTVYGDGDTQHADTVPLDSQENEDVGYQQSNPTIQPRQSTSTSTRTLYITVNVCTQPQAADANLEPPAQLELYISQSEKNKNPGPGKDSNTQQAYSLEGGAAMVVLNATGDVYMGLTGRNLTGNYTGPWNAQIAASIDAPYHSYNSADSNLVLVDSDSGSALFITNDLTNDNGTIYDEWVNLTPPFTMFASKIADTSIMGLEFSYCGLEKVADIAGTINGGQNTGKVEVSMTTRGEDNNPKQQFYFGGLSPGTSYYGIMAMNGNATALGRAGVGGGGQVWKAMTFPTLSDGNCAVVYNLSFCDQVAYAVPSNPNRYPNVSALAEFYDNSTKTSYDYFRKALAQIPCNTTSSAQYSLAQNCTTCDIAYKTWLCSVSIPRCTDFSSKLPWLQERAMGQPFLDGKMLDASLVAQANNSLPINGSRNPNIDTFVQPGPYKEILPCDDLCYAIVRACPAAMSFGCPTPGDVGFNQSYGIRKTASETGQVTCNYPGAAHDRSSGYRGSIPRAAVVATTILSITVMSSGI
ncbi:stretch-activated cation channel mid1 [Clarireedia jacksonii]